MRSQLVSQATNFLRHEGVRGARWEEQRAFLVAKGLTDEEIDGAILMVSATPPEKARASGLNHSGQQDKLNSEAKVEPSCSSNADGTSGHSLNDADSAPEAVPANGVATPESCNTRLAEAVIHTIE